MPKKENNITVYLDADLLSRFSKAKLLRQKLVPPGYKSVSSYAAYLIEGGLKVEEKELEDMQNKANRPKKVDKEQ